MSFLEQYGAGDEKRGKRIRLLVLSALGTLVIGASLYFGLRDRSEEQRIQGFLAALQRQDLPLAYTFWGCTQETPCRDYNFGKFVEDWGPKGANAKAASGSLVATERCGTGLISTVGAGSERVALWVERGDGNVSYAPWQECPERRLRVMKWLRMKFGS